MVLRTEPSSRTAVGRAGGEPASTLRPTLVATNLVVRRACRGPTPRCWPTSGRVSAARAGTRFFAAELDGVLAGYCELYLHDGVAQVEDVNTLEGFRNRGAGRAFVLGAIAAARAAGADLVWLLADAEDWPQHLYATLGFEDVGGVVAVHQAGSRSTARCRARRHLPP